jgi:PAS domain S-box-containing protein
MIGSSTIDRIRTTWHRGLRPFSAAAIALAITCVAIATALRFALGFISPDIVPFATYYPAILLVTFLARAPAGALALALSAIASWWFFLPPPFTFFPVSLPEIVNILIYLCVGAIMVWTVDSIRGARRQLTESLEAASQLNAVVSYSADAIIGFALDGTISSWNAGAERMFGYRAEEIIGRPIQVLVPPDRLDEPKHLFPRTSAGEMVHFETVRIGKAGQRVDVSISTGPIRSRSGTITGVSAIFHDITERKRREEHINFVLRELSHRAKNLLAVVQAIARQTGRQTANMRDFEQRFTARIQSLAQSHDILVKQDWRGSNLQDLVASQLTPFTDVGKRVVTEGPDLMLNPRAVEQIGIALHELATNAVKHGALSVPNGQVSVSWKLVLDGGSDDHLKIVWHEHGGPACAPPESEGFGHLVVRKLVPTALEGRARLEFPQEGLRWTLELPLKNSVLAQPPL